MSTLHYEDEQAEIHKLVVGPMDNNVFVLRCKQTGEAVLVDAANEHERLLELCRGLGVRRVLETHGHWDHIQAVPALREAGYEVAITSQDAPRLAEVGYDVFLDDAEVVEVGRLRLHAIHTPGHTPGSICLHLPEHDLLLSGDTLFAGSYGRYDLPGGDPRLLRDSLRRLAALPGRTRVLPGHGPQTTIGDEPWLLQPPGL
jgi:glyoxylase-like metal-dependent hydrolase (beta-lactamase superfamily II)